MEKNQVVSTEKTFEQLLAEAGIVKKEKDAELSPQQKVEKVKSLLVALEAAKALKNLSGEKEAKKIRRILRKKFQVKVSELKKVVLPETK